MSKSKGNTVDPQGLINQYGADTVRLFTMFAAPPEQSLEWSDSGVEGAYRFLRKLWKTVHTHLLLGDAGELQTRNLSEKQKDIRRKTHETIVKVTDDYGRRQTFNTAIAAVMELLNEVNKKADHSTPDGLAVEREALKVTTLLLAPIVPHICHTLWQAMGFKGAVIDAPWPTHDEAALTRSSISMIVQVNGKLRAKLEVETDADQQRVKDLAMENENVLRFIDNKTVRKIIFVPDKLINIVV
jgi:leucyl-tRNA synthetase